MNDMHIDINVGMFYSELIMFFIIVASAATIYKAGAKDVSQLDLAAIAEVLRPLAGDAAYLLFTLGIVGIGLLAIPVLAGSAAYALSEVFGWGRGSIQEVPCGQRLLYRDNLGNPGRAGAGVRWG